MAERDASQAIILAAGRGSLLSPYTDRVPTALISIAGRPMIAHTLTALRRQGVTHFVVCRGWQGDAFDIYRAELGEGVTLVDCPDYADTGMLETLCLALQHLRPGSFYLCYGDIIFRPTVVRQLRENMGSVSIVVNVASPGAQSKGLKDVEIVTTNGVGAARVVRRIGKARCASIDDAAGEFAGLAKFSISGRALVEETLHRLHPYLGSSVAQDSTKRPKTNSFPIPWWLEPVHKASICDMLQLIADEGADIATTMIYGGWHEVNTPQDLTRVWNDTATFLSEADARTQVAAMGACFLSEANDLKRPLYIVAKELNVELVRLESLLRGELEVGEALDILRKMSEVYPVPLNDLWLDADDTLDGVRLFKADASQASARILDRPDRTGKRTPYYEYRDVCMTRCSQFRPEWIKELRVVTSGDPLDTDVAMNNGHLMMQTTLFIGPVDFYWKDRHGAIQRREMNTGDSNFISPFVPHSFTVRNSEQEGIIIAVTYGGRVRRAFTEFARVGADQIKTITGDKRDVMFTRRCVLKRHLDAECMSGQMLASSVEPQISAERVALILDGHESTYEELEVLAKVFNVCVSDLLTCSLQEDEEVVVTKSSDSHACARHLETYILAPLARTRHQPDLKTFDLQVLASAQPGETLNCGLHSFIYHFGTEPIELSWGQRGKFKHNIVVAPGDSVYVAPLVDHRFSVCAAEHCKGADRRRLFVVRIPGHLTGETCSEFATFASSGQKRVGAETVQWYN